MPGLRPPSGFGQHDPALHRPGRGVHGSADEDQTAGEVSTGKGLGRKTASMPGLTEARVLFGQVDAGPKCRRVGQGEEVGAVGLDAVPGTASRLEDDSGDGARTTKRSAGSPEAIRASISAGARPKGPACGGRLPGRLAAAVSSACPARRPARTAACRTSSGRPGIRGWRSRPGPRRPRPGRRG